MNKPNFCKILISSSISFFFVDNSPRVLIRLSVSFFTWLKSVRFCDNFSSKNSVSFLRFFSRSSISNKYDLRCRISVNSSWLRTRSILAHIFSFSQCSSTKKLQITHCPTWFSCCRKYFRPTGTIPLLVTLRCISTFPSWRTDSILSTPRVFFPFFSLPTNWAFGSSPNNSSFFNRISCSTELSLITCPSNKS